jgi:hypothetical protein
VADWGSETPLDQVVRLTEAASRLVSFLWIPPDVASTLQRDSPFPEVLALNAAARRAKGEYIGRIDQDTLVGGRFLRTFFDLAEGRDPRGTALASSLWYANRRSIPYRFGVRCPPLEHVDRLVRLFGSWLPVGRVGSRPFWTYWVGIWLAHRDIWQEARGFDERLIYYNWMEVEMIRRLKRRYEVIVDLGAMIDYDFYHLEHVAPGTRPGTRHARKNTDLDWNAEPQTVDVNNELWGLAEYDLSTRMAAPFDRAPLPRPSPAAFLAIAAVAGAQMGMDGVVARVTSLWRTWHRRVARIGAVVRDQPVGTWLRTVASLWRTRRTEN